MRVSILLVLILCLSSCSWPHIATTYGSRYGFNVEGAVYAESKGFKIVDRPDLNMIFITPPMGTPQLKYPDNPKAFEMVAMDYLNLDRKCEIKSTEVIMLASVEYTYSCKK